MTYNNKNIDSIRRTSVASETSRNTNQKALQTKNFYVQPTFVQNDLVLDFEQPKNKIGFSVPKLKTVSIIVTTIILTAMISVAGQGYASYKAELEVTDNLSNNWSQKEVPLDNINTDLANNVILTTAFVQTQDKLTIQDKPTIIYSEPEETSAEIKQRAEFLKQYLTERKSPAAAYADSIAKLSQWKLVVGIMRAESQWCKKHVTGTKNCHGIGGAWNLRRYTTYEESFKDVNRIIQTKYVDLGLNTPEKIVNKYVGHASPNWVAAVRAELSNFENIP